MRDVRNILETTSQNLPVFSPIRVLSIETEVFFFFFLSEKQEINASRYIYFWVTSRVSLCWERVAIILEIRRADRKLEGFIP